MKVGSTILKGQYATDIFTTQREAIARSMDMGLNGETHIRTDNNKVEGDSLGTLPEIES